MTPPGHVDSVLVSIDALSRADGFVSVPIDSIFVSEDAFFVTAAALDGRNAAVPRHENRRLGPTHGAATYFTRNDTSWLQAPCPLFVVARTLTSTVVATGSPVIVVFAGNAFGASTHVLPPSMLYGHSYDARAAAVFAMTWTVPDVAPCRTSNDCF